MLRPFALGLALLLAACGSDPAPSAPRAADAPSDTVDADAAAARLPAAALTADQAAADALQAGDRAPSFTLPDADGAPTSLAEALAGGPVVLTFYRGSWCPYCNTQLQDYAARYGALRDAGATLLAVSPQAAAGTAAMRDSLGGASVPFPVLSDVGNAVSRRYGLVFEVDEATQQRYRAVGIDLAQVNGRDTWELPVPATYVIDRSGEIRAAFVEADYTRRASLDEVLDAVRRLSA